MVALRAYRILDDSIDLAGRNHLTTRDRLRLETRELHDRLDQAMPHNLADPACYARFLRIQLGARIPVESWLASHAEESLVPPPQTANIIADLKELDSPCTVETHSFPLAPDADPLGVAWVLAGSHLGNRFLLQKLPQDAGLPTAFLGDSQMADFWKSLQPRLRQGRSEQAIRSIIQSAQAVFTLFLLQLDEDGGRLAA